MSDWNPKVGEIWRWYYADNSGNHTDRVIRTVVDKHTVRVCNVRNQHSNDGTCGGCDEFLSAEEYTRKYGGTGRWEYIGDGFEKWVRDTRAEAGV